MNRLTRALFLALLTVLIVASATDTFGGAPAGSCWWRIRSDPPGGGAMKVTYKVGGALVTSTVATIAGATGGQTAARDVAAALCDAQRAQPGGTCAAQCDQGTLQDNVAYACTATNGETYTITANFGGGLNSNLRLNAVAGQVDKANMQWQYTFTSDLLETSPFASLRRPTGSPTSTLNLDAETGVQILAGQLMARGTLTQPVRLMMAGTQRWGYLEIKYPATATLAYVRLENGGGVAAVGDGATLVASGDGITPIKPVVRVEHVLVGLRHLPPANVDRSPHGLAEVFAGARLACPFVQAQEQVELLA